MTKRNIQSFKNGNKGDALEELSTIIEQDQYSDYELSIIRRLAKEAANVGDAPEWYSRKLESNLAFFLYGLNIGKQKLDPKFYDLYHADYVAFYFLAEAFYLKEE